MTSRRFANDHRERFVAAVVFATLSLILAGIGYFFYNSERNRIVADRFQLLSTLAVSKAQEIQHWKEESLSEVKRGAKDSRLLTATSKLLAAPEKQDLRKELSECLRDEFSEADPYVAMVADTHSRPLPSRTEPNPPLNDASSNAVTQALSSKEPVFSDVFLLPNGLPQIDLAAPIRDREGHPVAVLILRQQVDSYLVPPVRSRLTDSSSIEPYLVRRDGDEALVLRAQQQTHGTHDKESVFPRVPLTDADAGEVQAILGKRGRFQGKDYRGLKTFQYIMPVEGSPWFVIASIEDSAIEALASHQAAIITVITALTILLTGSLVALLYRNRQNRILKRLFHSLSSESDAKAGMEASESRMRDILRMTTDGFFVTDKQGNITDVNESACKMTGYNTPELRSMNIAALTEFSPGSELSVYAREVFAKGKDRYESRLATKGGNAIHVEASVQYMPKEEWFFLFLRDISERKATETRLGQMARFKEARSECSEAVLHSKNSGELMRRICRIMVDQGGMTFAWLGKPDSRTQGICPDYSYGEGADYLEGIEISFSPDLPAGHGPTGTCFRENRAVWFSDFLNDPLTQPWHERARRFHWKSGGAIPLRLHGKPVAVLSLYSTETWDMEQDKRELFVNLGEIIGLALDRFALEEERKAREEELTTLRTAVSQSASTILVTDQDGNIEYVNAAFEKISGYTKAEVMGRNPRILNSGNHSREFYQELWSCIVSGKSWQGEFQNKRKDGSLYWESAVISPVMNEKGQVVHIIAIKEDITSKKILEENLREALDRAEAANRAKTEFLGVMSHELRTPLNGILGFSELLLENQNLPPQVEDKIRIIQSSGMSLLRILEDILDFTRVEGGSLKLQCIPFSISELAWKSIHLVETSAQSKALQLSVILDETLPGTLLGDPERIQQVLLNFLRNAVKFTDHGSVTLSVTLVASSGDSHRILFSVEDTGPGIPEDQQARIFLPFTQGDSTFSRKHDGIGMGLTISERLLEKMNSSVLLTSRPGKGSIFSFELVLSSGSSMEPPPDAAFDPGSLDSGFAGRFPKKILAVEDNPINLTLLLRLLGNLGYRDVRTATSGEAALELVAKERFDLIFMDLQMPGIDGLATARKIHELEAGKPPVTPATIIAMTANTSPSVRRECFEAGMNRYISKPFNTRALAEAISASPSFP